MADEDTNQNPPETPEKSEEQTTNDLLQQLLSQQAEHRAEIAEMRAELDRQRTPMPRQAPSIRLSDDELLAARMEEINQHDYYCPGCGALYDRPRECTGRGEAPHPAYEVISTDELKSGDESKHTAAAGVRP